MIDFDKLFEDTVKKETNLFAVVFGSSGGGKSSIAGTLPGKTIILHTLAEKHSVLAAQTLAAQSNVDAKIRGICIDADKSPDAALAYLNDLLLSLGNTDVDNIVLDSLNSLEGYVLRTSTRFAKECRSEKGNHNSFQETPVITTMLREIGQKLNLLHNKGKNVIATCAVNVQALNDDGSIANAAPMLSTFGVALTVAQLFPTVLLVGRVGDEHLLQFRADMKKESKDALKRLMKTENFSPRIAGLLVDQLPETSPADLSLIIKVIKGEE